LRCILSDRSRSRVGYDLRLVLLEQFGCHYCRSSIKLYLAVLVAFGKRGVDLRSANSLATTKIGQPILVHAILGRIHYRGQTVRGK
jgi:hypothetical protein